MVADAGGRGDPPDGLVAEAVGSGGIGAGQRPLDLGGAGSGTD